MLVYDILSGRPWSLSCSVVSVAGCVASNVVLVYDILSGRPCSLGCSVVSVATHVASNVC